MKVIVDYVTSSRYEFEEHLTPQQTSSGALCRICLGEALDLGSYPEGAAHDPDVCIKGSSGGHKIKEKSPLLFCPSKIRAFSLRHKSWSMVRPLDLDEVQRQETPFKELRMNSQDRANMESLVLAYREDCDFRRHHDIISGKGQGVNIFLHGNSGTGKTLSAGEFLISLKLFSQGDRASTIHFERTNTSLSTTH